MMGLKLEICSPVSWEMWSSRAANSFKTMRLKLRSTSKSKLLVARSKPFQGAENVSISCKRRNGGADGVGEIFDSAPL